MIISGIRNSNLGNITIKNTTCSHCHQTDDQIATVFGKYFHIFWIPMFPLGKSVTMECQHCLKTIREFQFSPEQKKQYQHKKQTIKRPLWHWAGLLLFGGLMILPILLGIMGAILSITSSDSSSSQQDPRTQLLQLDEDRMSKNPTMKSDSISYQLKEVFDEQVSEALHPSDFNYFSSIKGNNLLILVQIRKLKKVDKASRPEILEIIEEYVSTKPSLNSLNLYVGLHGKYNMMLIKTPTTLQNRNFVADTYLYDFYGSKELYIPVKDTILHDSIAVSN